MQSAPRQKVTTETAHQILADRKSGMSIRQAAEKYHVGTATVKRIGARAREGTLPKPMYGPLGAQYRISYTWYKVKGNMVFYWWEEFQEWISSTMEPSELRREGERVGQ